MAGPRPCEQCHPGMVVMGAITKRAELWSSMAVLQFPSLGFCPSFHLQRTLSYKMKETLPTSVVFRHGIYDGNKAPTKTPAVASSDVFPYWLLFLLKGFPKQVSSLRMWFVLPDSLISLTTFLLLSKGHTGPLPLQVFQSNALKAGTRNIQYHLVAW